MGERPSAVHQSIDTSVGPLIVVGRIGSIHYKSAIRELKEGGDTVLSQLQLVHDDVGGGDDESIREYVPIELQLVSVHRTINDLPQQRTLIVKEIQLYQSDILHRGHVQDGNWSRCELVSTTLR